jgi:antitoxin (DNA-binding transcriptional repressor) of toxin-antitoxin stability system
MEMSAPENARKKRISEGSEISLCSKHNPVARIAAMRTGRSTGSEITGKSAPFIADFAAIAESTVDAEESAKPAEKIVIIKKPGEAMGPSRKNTNAAVMIN